MASADDKRARFSEARNIAKSADRWLALCRGQSCRVREVCARYTSTPADWQTYIAPAVQGPQCAAFVGRSTVADLRDLAAVAKQRAAVATQLAVVAKQRADVARHRADLARDMLAHVKSSKTIAELRAHADQAEADAAKLRADLAQYRGGTE